MNARTILGFTGALVTAGALAACGGGGSTTHLVPSAVTSPASGGASTITSQGTTTKLTFSIDRAPHSKPNLTSAGRSGASAHRDSVAKRSPQYLSGDQQGMQITVTSGTSTQTFYYATSVFSPLCTVDQTTQIETCTITVPTLGTVETFSAIEVDEAPSNESMTTGQGTAFPSNSHVLATGSQTLTLTLGAVNTIPFVLSPVVAGLSDYDCGSVTFSSNMGVDDNVDTTVLSGPRIVITPNVAASTFANPAAFDAAGAEILSPQCTTSSPLSCVGQSFVDANGSPVALTVTSTSSAITVYPVPIAQLPNFSSGGSVPMPLPSPFAQTASIPNSSYFYYDDCCGAELGVSASGAAVPAGTTVTLANGLTATPPIFTGAPAPNVTPRPGPYTTSVIYTIVTIAATPPTLTFVSPTDDPQVVTGTDFGAAPAQGGMYAGNVPANSGTSAVSTTTCTNGGTTIANIARGAFVGGSQPFTVSPAAMGTCMFVLYDVETLVVTNTIHVTVN